MLVSELRASLRSRTEVLRSLEGSVTLNGGLRNDFRDTVMLCGEDPSPSVVFWRLASGGPLDLGRMYCVFQTELASAPC